MTIASDKKEKSGQDRGGKREGARERDGEGSNEGGEGTRERKE